jgi:arylsulfate sulfotransferase
MNSHYFCPPRLKANLPGSLLAPWHPETLFRNPLLHRAKTLTLMLALLEISFGSQALTVLSGPTFVEATNAPLAGTLQLSTDMEIRISISVDDGLQVWKRNFYDYATTHSLPLLGFKPGRTNVITISLFDKSRNSITLPQPIVFVTPPLPSDFPSSVVFTSKPDQMEPGYTLFRIQNINNNHIYLGILDSSGGVIWYSGVTAISDVRQLANGDLFLPLATNFVEINMLGDMVQSWSVPDGLSIDSHDGVPTDHGSILYLNDASEVVTNFPTSATNPNAPLTTASVMYNRVVEISATNASLLSIWSPINFLDPRRLTYLTFWARTILGWDIEHANAVIEDPRDNSLIVSMRNQNIVFKFSRDTGQLRWILGPHENWGPEFQPFLLTPVGEPFEWHYGQHAPTLTPQGTLLLYDNGNYRATPFALPVADTNNYSRAVEYSIDEERMEVRQVWDCGRTNTDLRLYTDRGGNAEWEPHTGNVLIDFDYVMYANGVPPSQTAPRATMMRLREVTHAALPEVVFDVAFFDFSNTNTAYKGSGGYRCHRIPDLYAHPALPVMDLSLDYADGLAHLTFSADHVRTYLMQTSTNLVDWIAGGVAVEDEAKLGNFSFEDTLSIGLAARYYRVVTQ